MEKYPDVHSVNARLKNYNNLIILLKYKSELLLTSA